MSASVRQGMAAGLCLILAAGVGLEAHAFMPMGGFDEYNRLVYTCWSWDALHDTNGDGDISGDDEGVEILIEGGLLGWTDEEIEIIEEAFDVWEDVPTAYAAVQIMGVNEDPIAIGEIGGLTDFLNYVAVEVAADPEQVLTDGVLGLTIITSTIDETEILYEDVVGTTVSAGQILEADIVIDGASHRSLVAGEDPLAPLKGTLVHEIGHFFGLGHTAVNNLELIEITELPVPSSLAESRVMALRDGAGVLSLVGATPTMFPVYFVVDDGAGGYVDGAEDLAVDDIAGLSFLYPRGSQDGFFSVSQEARTQTRPNFPSLPVIGGHIVAWCDVDNDPNTPRIPLVSTQTGVYEYEPLLAGNFDLYGLPKTLETSDGTTFQASYTFTCSPMNGLSLERQAPPGYAPEDFDSIEGGIDLYNIAFPSEVFHETGNLFDIKNHDVGTPVAYDEDRQQIVSLDTSKTLSTMLAGLKPMFGDRNDVCPYNIIISGIGGDTGDVTGITGDDDEKLAVGGALAPRTTRFIRGFRDRVMLESAVGSALVELYYQVSPSMARFLLRHGAVVAAARRALAFAEWCSEYYQLILAAIGGIMATLILLRRKWCLLRRTWRLLVSASLILLMMACMPAYGRIANLSDEDMVELSDHIVTGTVESVESRWQEYGERKRIVTDITLSVSDDVKGGLNKSGTLALQVLGGRIGSLVTRAAELPTFTEDEEVLLYLQYDSDRGYVVVAGIRGKLQVTTEESSGKKSVVGASAHSALALTESAKAMGVNLDEEEGIPLDAYKDYLGGIVKEQQDQEP